MRRRAGKRILVAGIGNAWMKDDAFGGKVAERLEGASCPEGTAVFDFGTGGLDLAYEAMRGYDALVLIDVSRQGGEPGTLYVMDADPDDLEPIADGEVLSPHGMDPQTVLRFVKAVGGWPGKVVDRSPASRAASRRWGWSSRRGRRGRRARRRGRAARRSPSYSRTRPTAAGAEMHELSVSSAIVDTAIRHARGRRVNAVHLQLGALRQVVPASLDFYFGIVGRETICDGAALELDLIAALMSCGACGNEWDPAPEPLHGAIAGVLLPQFRCPPAPPPAPRYCRETSSCRLDRRRG